MNKSRLLLPLQTSIAAVSFRSYCDYSLQPPIQLVIWVWVKQIVGFFGGLLRDLVKPAAAPSA